MFTIKKNPQRTYYSLAREALYEKRLQQKELTPLETRYQERLQQEKKASQEVAPEEKTIPTKAHTSIPDPLVKDFIDKPEPNTVYVAGSEGPSEGLVAIPLEIAEQIDNLKNIMESFGNNFENLIPISNFSSKTIKNVVNFLKKFTTKPKHENPLHEELFIESLMMNMNLNESLECIAFMHNQGLTKENLLSIIIDVTLKRIAQGVFEPMKYFTILDKVGHRDDLAKKIIYDPLQETLRLLLMKKYANERKIILECHSAGTYRVLCSTDGTTIASQGRSTAEKKNYDTFCISHIATNEPLAKEWFRDESIFYNESPIKIFDISKDGHKILFYSSKKSARGLLPGLYIIYSNQKNTFEAKQLKGYFGPYRSARFNPSGTKIITHKSVENKTDFNWWNTDNVNSPEGSSEKLVPLNSQIIFSDFIDDETIIVFVRENETFQILSYNITSGEKKSIELFRYEQNKTQDTFYNIDKNKGIIAVYHVNKNHLYILNKMSIDNNKINPITPENRFTESAIKLSSDGSTIIGDDHGKARNIFDIQTNKVLQTVLTLPVDIFNNRAYP